MRNGALITEAVPASLYARFNTNSLEKAFFKICEKQDKVGEDHSYECTDDNHRLRDRATTKCYQDNLEQVEHFSGKNILLKLLNLKALVIKNFLQIVRRPA